MSKRLKAMGQPNYQDEFKLSVHPHTLDAPLKLKRPQVIFVNSMSDLFHKDVSTSFIKDVFAVMEEASHHRFQVLTKRSKRLMRLSPKTSLARQRLDGCECGKSDYVDRIDHLRETGAVTKFLSIEPLLGAVPNMNLNNIDWAIVGGESGPKSRPVHIEWVLDIKKQCERAKVPFFFKQWAERTRRRLSRTLEGRTWDEMPDTAYA